MIISNPLLPLVPLPKGKGLTICRLGHPNAKPGGFICRVTTETSEAVEVALPAYEGDTAVIPVAGDLEEVAAIEIGGMTYVQSVDVENIAPGSFVWDKYARTITIRFWS